MASDTRILSPLKRPQPRFDNTPPARYDDGKIPARIFRDARTKLHGIYGGPATAWSIKLHPSLY